MNASTPFLCAMKRIAKKYAVCAAAIALAFLVHNDGVRPALHLLEDILYLQAIPLRPPGAMTGSEFAQYTMSLSEPERQQAALQEVLRGNVPDFLRTLTSVSLSCATDTGDTLAATIYVMPDYLAIGADWDFLRIPLSYPVAAEIARAFGCVLPTRKLVDAIYAQSAHHLTPHPMPPGPQMRSMAYFLEHQRKIEAQRRGRPLGELVSGHKKDLVLTNRLFVKPDRVAIYGWHQRNGEPIQPLSTIHGVRYADYSHGLRLIDQRIYVGQTQRSIFDVLEDPLCAPLITDEGCILQAQTLLMPRRQG